MKKGLKKGTIKVTADREYLNEITIKLIKTFGTTISPASEIKNNDKDSGCHCYFTIEEVSS